MQLKDAYYLHIVIFSNDLLTEVVSKPLKSQSQLQQMTF